MKSLKDEQLVEKVIKNNDSNTFGLLYDRYADKVYNKCYSFVRDEDEAKDLAQDIFLKVFMKLSSYNALKASFSTWLYAVTYNYCTNHVTRNKKRKNKHGPIGKYENYLDEMDDVDIQEINQLNIDKLEKALENIPPEDKSLLFLKYQDDTSIKEIQTALGISESAVKMRLNRAKKKVVDSYNKLS